MNPRARHASLHPPSPGRHPHAPFAIGAASLFVCALWAVWPLDPAADPEALQLPPSLTSSVTAPAPPRTSPVPPLPMPASLDLAAFSRPLWPVQVHSEAPTPTPTPTPAAAATALAAPASPPRLLLLAITREDGRYVALLHDPDRDALITLSEGDEAGGHAADAVLATSVRLRRVASGTIDTLALVDPPSVPTPKAGAP